MSAVTMWVAGDFEKESARKLLLSALKHVVSIVYSLFCPPHSTLSTYHLVLYPVLSNHLYRGVL